MYLLVAESNVSQSSAHFAHECSVPDCIQFQPRAFSAGQSVAEHTALNRLRTIPSVQEQSPALVEKNQTLRLLPEQKMPAQGFASSNILASVRRFPIPRPRAPSPLSGLGPTFFDVARKAYRNDTNE